MRLLTRESADAAGNMLRFMRVRPLGRIGAGRLIYRGAGRVMATLPEVKPR